MEAILTETQRAAVNSTAQETSVMCGAGSGKTTVLTHRIAKMVGDGVSPYEIMVLTFTRKAANEMIERVSALLGSDVMKTSMMIGTFHAVALAIVRCEGQACGYEGERLTVIEPDDGQLLLTHIAGQLGYIKRGTWRAGVTQQRLTSFLSAYYNTGEWPRTSASAHGSTVDIDLQRIAQAYHVELLRMNVVDFGTLLVACRSLLAVPEIRERWNERIRHVLVDEVQDTDEIQYDIHRFFCPPATLFVVGDRRQSIYGFRGARPDLFRDQYAHATQFVVPECFRSVPEIVEVANSLYAAGTDTLAARMVPVRPAPNGPAVWLVNGRSMDLVGQIGDAIRHGFKPGEIAVLARSHRPLRRLAEVIDEAFAGDPVHAIPYRRIGATFDICNTEEFRRHRAALRLCVNKSDDLAFLRLAYNEFALQPDELADVRGRAAEHGGTLFGAWYARHVGERRFEQVQAAVGDLALTIASHDVSMGLKATAWAIAEAMRCPGPAPYRRVAYWWQTMYGGGTVHSALLNLSLRDSQSDMAAPTDADNRVTLATIHAAKGLEWPCVILVEMHEGSLPTSQALKRKPDRARRDAIEEERRVAYVGVTRACDVLVVHRRLPHDCDVRRKPAKPSRFIDDMGIPTHSCDLSGEKAAIP